MRAGCHAQQGDAAVTFDGVLRVLPVVQISLTNEFAHSCISGFVDGTFRFVCMRACARV